MSRQAGAAYPWIVKRMPGIPPAASTARPAARAAAKRAWHALVQVLIGPDRAPWWRWRSSQERWAAYAGLGLVTVALCVVNAATMHGVATMHGPLSGITLPPADEIPPSLAQQAVAAAVVAPLLLAARYPLLTWRIEWLALLLVPLVPAAWWGG